MFKKALMVLAWLLLSSGSGLAASLPVGQLTHDGPATPEQLSLVMLVTGPLTQAATATVRYKPTSSGSFVAGHPLFRIRPSFSEVPAVGSVIDAFAWPIIGLTPGTSYDVEVTVSDGVTTELRTGTFVTRALPAVPGAPNKTIMAGSSAATIQAVLNSANPGDVIQFQDGTYNVALTISRNGTLANPIVIQGASRAGVVLHDNGRVFQVNNSSDIVIENMTITGSGVDSGTDSTSVGIEYGDSTTVTRLTVRNVTMTGVDRAVGPAVTGRVTLTGALVYNNTFVGNNTWTRANLTSNLYWNDDGINLGGQGNVAFNNTLKGFGDTLSFASTSDSQTLTDNRGVHFYRNDVWNSGDDLNEADHAIRNCSFYDNRSTNSMTATSFDPLYGGPFLYARNIVINTGRTPHKWNSTNSGQFLYNNTFILTTHVYLTTPGLENGEAGWFQPNNGDQRSYGFRNNVFVYRGQASPSGLQTIRLDNSGHDPVDFTHNSWYPDAVFQWPQGRFSSLAAAFAGLQSTSPVFSGATHRHQNDNITTANPWTTTITLGSDFSTEITVRYTPTLAIGTAPKNSGAVIPNITDGFTGVAPDRGAVIEGQALPVIGEPTGGTPPAAPTSLRIF